MKKLSIIILAFAIAFPPVCAYAQAERDEIVASVSGVMLSVNDGSIHVVGANGEVMEIFNLTGTKVAAIRIDSADKTINPGLPKGCYLIKIGKIVRKISLK